MKHSAPIKAIVDRLTKDLSNGPNGYHSRRLHMKLTNMAKAVEGLEALAANRSPRDTEEAHYLKVANATKQLAGRAQKMRDQLQDELREGTLSLDDEIRSQAGLKQTEYAGEIRAAMRSMDSKQRSEVLNNALQNDDGATIAAISDAPAMLSGVTPDIQARYVESISQKLAPELVAQQSELMDAFDSGLAVLRSVDNAVNKGFDPQKIAEINAREAESAESTRLFNSAVSADEA